MGATVIPLALLRRRSELIQVISRHQESESNLQGTQFLILGIQVFSACFL